MNRDQALSKIKKCLSLAKSTNPHEAAAAMRQAQKLMAEHRLTELDVSLTAVSEQAAPTRQSAMTPWESLLSSMVATAFGCQQFFQERQHFTRSHHLVNKRYIVFVGVGAAPQVAGYAYEVLSRQCAKDRLEYVRAQRSNCKAMTKTARGDEFAFGWVIGVKSEIQSFAGNERNNELIKQYISTRYSTMQAATIRDRAKGRNVSEKDVASGHIAGKQAKLNRGVAGTSKQSLLANGDSQ